MEVFRRDLLSFIPIDQTQDGCFVLTLQWNYEWYGYAKSSTDIAQTKRKSSRDVILMTQTSHESKNFQKFSKLMAQGPWTKSMRARKYK